MLAIRFLLLPLTFLYSIILFLRSKLFDWNVLKCTSFNNPIINIGNLALGGTGKTPHIEYLIKLLNKDNSISTLSRGYKRQTKGLIIANDTHNSKDIGDEPLQYFNKFDDINVVVDSNRINAINTINKDLKSDIILLDDCFQHRKVKPGLNILLSDYYKIYTSDILVPSGTLRDIKYNARLADIIVITKSPVTVPKILREDIERKIKPKENQKIFYSSIKYTDLLPLNPEHKEYNDYSSILMVSGIANHYPLESYLKKKCSYYESLVFADHHNFTDKDIRKIKLTFDKILGKKKIIITTEKDAMRLKNSEIFEKIKELPIYYQAIKINFHNFGNQITFDEYIIDYVRKNKREQ